MKCCLFDKKKVANLWQLCQFIALFCLYYLNARGVIFCNLEGVFVCVCECMCVFVSVCVCMCMYVSVCVCMWVIRVCVCLCNWVCLSCEYVWYGVYVCVFLCWFNCVFVCVSVCVVCVCVWVWCVCVYHHVWNDNQAFIQRPNLLAFPFLGAQLLCNFYITQAVRMSVFPYVTNFNRLE